MSNEILSLQEIANLALENMTDHLMFPMLCTKDFQDELDSYVKFYFDVILNVLLKFDNFRFLYQNNYSFIL